MRYFNNLWAIWCWIWDPDLAVPGHPTYTHRARTATPPASPNEQLEAKRKPILTVLNIGKTTSHNTMLKRQLIREPAGTYNIPLVVVKPDRKAPPHKNDYSWNQPTPGKPDHNDSSGTLPFESITSEQERIVEEMARRMFGSEAYQSERDY